MVNKFFVKEKMKNSEMSGRMEKTHKKCFEV